VTPATSVEVRGVSRAYGGRPALSEVRLSAFEGELVAIMGPNGSGKTTLLSIVAGQLAPDGGDVAFPTRGTRDRRAFVGWCPQGSSVFGDLTAREQVELAGRAFGASRAGARKRADCIFSDLGLAADAGKLASALSGGMLRRLNVALSLASAPGILCLDEPTAGLDAEQKALLYACLARERARGTTIVMASHDLDEIARISDRVCVMSAGRVVRVDTPDALMRGLGGAACVEIDLAEHEPVPRAEIEGVAAGVTGVRARRWQGRTLVCDVDEILGPVARVAEALGTRGVVPVAVRARRASLGDVFFALTGRTLDP
jgi:ABC-type multidrug transport system ATPase subunit